MSYSYRSIIDGGADSDMIYYNASIVASQQSDLNPSATPIQIRFNETRDAPIVKDAAQYYFSIIRFSMNGPNKNLPLFIPIIQTNGFNYTTQTDPNLTIYYASIPYQRTWYVSLGAGLPVHAPQTLDHAGRGERPQTDRTATRPAAPKMNAE